MRNFDIIFDKIKTELDAATVKAGENGTGYFDGLCRVRMPASMTKFTDDLGRRGIVLKTFRGNVVFFERYTDRPDVFAYNCPQSLKSLMRTSIQHNCLNDEQLGEWIGHGTPRNQINHILEDLAA